MTFDKKMNRRYTVICFVLLAALFTFSQTAWLVTVPDPPPELSSWLAEYRWRSSIESFGFAILLVAFALGLSRFRHRVINWSALLLILIIAWRYMGRELWIHYVELPERFEGKNIQKPPYFSFTQPWSAIPRMIWHLFIPLSAILIFNLLFKNKKIEQVGDGDAEEAV